MILDLRQAYAKSSPWLPKANTKCHTCGMRCWCFHQSLSLSKQPHNILALVTHHLSYTCWLSNIINHNEQNQPYKILTPSDIRSDTNMLVLITRTTIGFNISHINLGNSIHQSTTLSCYFLEPTRTTHPYTTLGL